MKRTRTARFLRRLLMTRRYLLFTCIFCRSRSKPLHRSPVGDTAGSFWDALDPIEREALQIGGFLAYVRGWRQDHGGGWSGPTM